MDLPYQQYFKAMPCYLTVQDRDFRILDANDRFQSDFGDSDGRHCYQVYKHRSERCEVCPVDQTFRDGEPHSSEETVRSIDGREVSVIVYTTPIRNEAGEITSVMEMSTDITEVKRLQSQLTSLGLLIGSISHGIRGLLNSLDGGAYLVNSGLEKDDEKRVRRGWEMVGRNVSRIRSMVLDILYYAKDRQPEWEPISALGLMEEVSDMLESKAREYGMELHRDLDENAGEFEGDITAIRSLLVNLIENSLDACRVDPKDGPHQIKIGLMGHDDHVVFEIVDNGIGMERETREKAFSLFFSSKGGEGTGLGLFISNKIALAHGGKIDLESEVNKGTRFVVSLPRERPKEQSNESHVPQK